ncbi:hypothetical protein [Stenotrophomonas aracearum]|uniref:Uncharacterized protein n=1 Tax=Stenotrophomonas aracearum TaxID=3003272 RepID=A0ABY9YFV5_9GAMM|nr:hypothetical protein [Stenotrophomonas sp. A5588]WNH49582.1 hypothetical protein PDM28_04495 [Stenotrophomonas sp. A5588]
MDDLWEVSVVVGIRDTQWVLTKDTIPDPTFNLAGNAEGRAGDIATALNGRFFLFEAKSQRSEFSSEWRPRKRGKDKIRRAKYAYEKLIKTATEVDHSQPLSQQNAFNMLLRSSLCHYFAYWQDKDKDSAIESICLSPYFIETALGSLSRLTDPSTIKKTAGCFDLTIADGNPCAAFTLAYAFEKRLGVRTQQSTDWFEIGLGPEEFQNYLNFLCEDSEGGTEPLNLIAFSTTGFMRIAKTVADLSSIAMSLSLTPEPNTKPTPPLQRWAKCQSDVLALTPQPDQKLQTSHPVKAYTPSTTQVGPNKCGPK